MIEIKIPLPPGSITAHNSGNWRSKSSGIKAYREACQLAAKIQTALTSKPLLHKVRIHHEWFMGKSAIEAQLGAKCPARHKHYRPADEGNAIQALKPAIDGLVDSGLLVDDRAAYVTWGEFVAHTTAKDHQGQSHIILRLVELPIEVPCK